MTYNNIKYFAAKYFGRYFQTSDPTAVLVAEIALTAVRIVSRVGEVTADVGVVTAVYTPIGTTVTHKPWQWDYAGTVELPSARSGSTVRVLIGSGGSTCELASVRGRSNLQGLVIVGGVGVTVEVSASRFYSNCRSVDYYAIDNEGELELLMLLTA